jgi:hypothetical protein
VLLLVTELHDDAPARLGGRRPRLLGVVELGWGQALTLACAALNEPNGPAAVRYLEHAVPRPGEDAIPGLNNLGMFARHTLTELAPAYPEWADCAREGAELTSVRGRELVEALGFQIEVQPGTAIELLRDGTNRAARSRLLVRQIRTNWSYKPVPAFGLAYEFARRDWRDDRRLGPCSDARAATCPRRPQRRCWRGFETAPRRCLLRPSSAAICAAKTSRHDRDPNLTFRTQHRYSTSPTTLEKEEKGYTHARSQFCVRRYSASCEVFARPPAARHGGLPASRVFRG